jgi:tetratricopeptide (TPR) repeat protein
MLLTAAFLASVIALIRWPRVGYLPAWFFITLAPTSSFLPIAAEVGADRRMYVPLMGLIVLAVVAGMWLLGRMRPASDGRASAGSNRMPVVAFALVTAVAVALGARTMARNRDYASELRLSQTTLDHWPSAVAHDMVGLSLARLERREEAIAELRQAVDDYAPARYDLGAQYYSLNRFDEAIDELRRFVALEPQLFTTSAAYTLIGSALDRRGRSTEAIDAYRHALAGPTPDLQAHGFLADLLLDAQKYDEAIVEYRAYLQTFPNRTAAIMNMGIALSSVHKPVEALAAFRRAADQAPSNRLARVNLTQMLLETGQFDAAAKEASQVISLAPRSPIGYDLLGQALASQKDMAGARRAFDQALQIDPKYAPARENLKRVIR